MDSAYTTNDFNLKDMISFYFNSNKMMQVKVSIKRTLPKANVQKGIIFSILAWTLSVEEGFVGKSTSCGDHGSDLGSAPVLFTALNASMS